MAEAVAGVFPQRRLRTTWTTCSRSRPLAIAVESLKLVSLAPEKDLSAWLGAGGTRERLLEIIHQTPELTPEGVAGWEPCKAEARANGGFQLTKLGDLMNEPEEQVSWLMNGIL